MLNTYFFADPNFLGLLEFWETQRGARALPDWDGDIGAFPRNLLPNLIVTDRRGESVYRFVGAECVRRWGSDPTGRLAYGDVLSGSHARYLRSLGHDTMTHGAPVFSTAVYQPNPVDTLMTGRLHMPFTYQGSRRACILVTLQFFRGSEAELREIGIRGVVHEIRRDLIASPPELCARLAEARRAYQISRHTHQRTLVQDVDTLVTELTGRVLVSLPCYDEFESPPDSPAEPHA
jgi:hypothetical protein